MGMYVGPSNWVYVTDGLVLNLDAADPRSYSGLGTTWTDISGSNNNGTLTDGAVYNSADGGSIFFDGTDDHVALNSSSSLTFGTGNFTINLYAKLTTIRTNQYFFDFFENNFAFQYYNTSGPTYVLRYLTNLTGVRDTVYTLNQNQIYNFCIVRNSGTGYLYLNGSQLNSWSDSENYTSNRLRIARFGGTFASVNLNGNVYVFSAYNRALTAAEIQRNFNTYRLRYGL